MSEKHVQDDEIQHGDQSRFSTQAEQDLEVMMTSL
jgi:hypothetical protein